MELSKRDKKVAREVIEKGLQIEFANGLKEAENVIANWEKNPQENRKAYHLLFKTIHDFNKHIANRYDRMTGSSYFYIVVGQFADKIITEEDLKDFSSEVYEKIVATKNLWEED